MISLRGTVPAAAFSTSMCVNFPSRLAAPAMALLAGVPSNGDLPNYGTGRMCIWV